MANKGSWLGTGGYLSAGDYLVSNNGQYFAIMQADGNFVLYYGNGPTNQGPAFWASNTAKGQGQCFAIMQADGNFVIYKGSDPAHQGAFVWNSGITQGQGQSYIVLQDDANLVVYKGSDPTHQGTLCWNTATITGVITVKNQGGYVARATVEWDLLGQHQSQSSDNFTSGQVYSVPTPIGAGNIHVKCEEATGLAWEPWKTVFDKTYPTPVLRSITLTGTTLNPGFTEEANTGLTKQTAFTFINDIDRPVYVAVHHLGAAGTPWRDGKPKCWDQTIQPNQGATYVPSQWIVNFTTWALLIADSLLCIVTLAATFLSGGAAAPAAAAAGELAAEEAATLAGEVVGEAVGSEVAASAVAEATTETALTRVASILGMDAEELSEAIGPYMQMAEKYGDLAGKTLSVLKDVAVAGIAVNAYNSLEKDGWALYIEIDGHGYYVSNFIVSGGNYYIPISLAVRGLEIQVNNQGAYVARCSVEWDLSGQHQSQASDNFPVAQSYSVLVPAGATNIHVKCEDETGLAWAPWKTILDETIPGPAKLGTLKAFKLTGTTLDPTYGEDAIIELAPARNGKSSWLGVGEYLVAGDYLVSNNGLYFAIMQNDGNFVLYHGSGPASQGPAFWASNTALGAGQYFAIMQSDGNFVIYRGSDPAHQGAFVWNSGTVEGRGQCFAVLQDDANFVIYKGSDPTHTGAFCWNSGVVNGQVTVKNQGAYVARCSVDYDFGGQRQHQASGNFNVGQSYSAAIPVGASNIEVKCEDETGLVWEPWKTILDKTYTTPPRKTFTLTGTTLNPGFNES